MKTLCGIILAAVVALSAHGAFDVRDFGAEGDGVAKDTIAVQKAIDAAHAAGGGEVLLPMGVYLCGSLFFKSGVDFHLAEGAVLKGSPDSEDYNATDVAPQNWGRLGSGDNISGGHLILCIEQENVTLRGPGKVDGNVGAFLKMPDGSHPPTKLDIPWRPAQMIWFVESRNVTIRDIEIADAPYWSCFIYGCEDVVVERANIHTVRNPHTYNGDGLDIDSSRRVRVTDCNISTADDAITLRAAGQGHLKNDGPCADITVSNCTFSSDRNAIRLGVGNGVIRDCSFTGIRIENTRYAVNAVGAWSRPEHGVDISNISFRDMQIDAKGFCKFYYKHATDSVFDGIAFRQVRGRVREPSIFDDTPKRPFRNLVFEDVKLEGETSPRVGVLSASATNQLVCKGERGKGALVLSFDDRNLADWEKAIPLFDKYGACATFFCTGKIEGDAARVLKKLRDHGHSIGLHGLNHQNADTAVAAKGVSCYWNDEIAPQLAGCRAAGIPITSFAYPNCRRTDETDELFSTNGFKHVRGGLKGVTPYDPKGEKQEGLKPVHTVDRAFLPAAELKTRFRLDTAIAGEAYHTDIEDILKCVRRCAEKNEAFVLTSHGIHPDAKHIHMKTEWLERILSTAKECSVAVLGFDELK